MVFVFIFMIAESCAIHEHMNVQFVDIVQLYHTTCKFKYTTAEDKKSWTKCAHHAGTHLCRGPVRNAGEFLFMVGFC